MEDITLKWDGIEYRIDAQEVLPVIAKIESIITLGELQEAAMKNTTPLAKVSMAYGMILRHAGATVTDNEVFEGMFDKGGQNAAYNAVYALITMMIPPKHLREVEDSDAPKKKSTAAKKGSSSKKPSKPQSSGE